MTTVVRSSSSSQTPVVQHGSINDHDGLLLEDLFDGLNYSIINYDYDQDDWLANQLEELYKILRASQWTINIALTVFLGIVFLIGLTGNILVLAVFSRSKIKQASTILIMALASNDLIICAVVLPGVLIKEWYVPFRWDIVCRGWEWLRCATIPLSALILAIVAVDRYILICRVGQLRAISTKKARYLIILVTFVSICHGIPPMLRVGVYQTASGGGTTYLGLCLSNDILINQHIVDHYWQAMAAEFMLVLITATVMYSLVFRTVYKQGKRWACVIDSSNLAGQSEQAETSKDTSRRDMRNCNIDKTEDARAMHNRLIRGMGSKKMQDTDHSQEGGTGELKHAQSSAEMGEAQQRSTENDNVRTLDSVTSLDEGHDNVLTARVTSQEDQSHISKAQVTTVFSCSGSFVLQNKKNYKNYKTCLNSTNAFQNHTVVKSQPKIGQLKRKTLRIFHLNSALKEIQETSKLKLTKQHRTKVNITDNELTSDSDPCTHGSMFNHFSLDTSGQLQSDAAIFAYINTSQMACSGKVAGSHFNIQHFDEPSCSKDTIPTKVADMHCDSELHEFTAISNHNPGQATNQNECEKSNKEKLFYRSCDKSHVFVVKGLTSHDCPSSLSSMNQEQNEDNYFPSLPTSLTSDQDMTTPMTPQQRSHVMKFPKSLRKTHNAKIHPLEENITLSQKQQQQKLLYGQCTKQTLFQSQQNKHHQEQQQANHQPKQQPQKRYSMAQVKTAKILLLVTIVYILSFAPVLLMILGVIPSHPIPFYCYFIHSSANPLIYSFNNLAFRRQLGKLLRCKTF